MQSGQNILTKSTLILTILLLSLAMYSCKNEQECFIPTNVSGKIQFSIKDSRDTLITTDTSIIDTTIITYRDSSMAAPALQSFTYDTNYTTIGVRGDNFVQFSLDPDLSSIQYKIIPNATSMEECDTINIMYASHLFFISNDCGYTYNYNIESVSITNHYIDSIAISNKEITTEGNKKHIRLFFFN